MRCSEGVQCLKDLDRRRYEENKLVLVETQRYPVLFHRDVVVDKMRELETKRMGEVSFQEFFEFCQQLDFEFQDRLVIRKCFNFIRNNLEDHHRSVLDKEKTDHYKHSVSRRPALWSILLTKCSSAGVYTRSYFRKEGI